MTQIFVEIMMSEDLYREINSLIAEEYIAWYQYHYPSLYFDYGFLTEVFKSNGIDELEDHVGKLASLLKEAGLQDANDTPSNWNELAVSKSQTTDMDVIKWIDLNLQAEHEAITHYTNVIALAIEQNQVHVVDVLYQILEDENDHVNILNELRRYYELEED